MKQVILFVMILVSGTTAFSAEPAPEEDYSLLEGKWMRNIQDGKGAPVRIEQEFAQKTSKVNVYDRNGKLFHAQQAKYRLQRVDELKLLVYYDLEVLEGSKKGLKHQAVQPCVYRLRGDQLIVVEGIVNGDTFPSQMIVWWRIKEPETPPEI
tara:strand:+ start:116060 stop:116515 length:456 start_codon:yes stop_codon:yes gene_type:complete